MSFAVAEARPRSPPEKLDGQVIGLGGVDNLGRRRGFGFVRAFAFHLFLRFGEDFGFGGFLVIDHALADARQLEHNITLTAIDPVPDTNDVVFYLGKPL